MASAMAKPLWLSVTLAATSLPCVCGLISHGVVLDHRGDILGPSEEIRQRHSVTGLSEWDRHSPAVPYPSSGIKMIMQHSIRVRGENVRLQQQVLKLQEALAASQATSLQQIATQRPSGFSSMAWRVSYYLAAAICVLTVILSFLAPVALGKVRSCISEVFLGETNSGLVDESESDGKVRLDRASEKQAGLTGSPQRQTDILFPKSSRHRELIASHTDLYNANSFSEDPSLNASASRLPAVTLSFRPDM